jgi:imidazolonepropionase-like amidohydrolase
MRADLWYTLVSLWSGPTAPRTCEVQLPLAPVTSQASVTAFIDVNVVPMDGDRVLHHQTVLIKDERIIALGPTNQVPVPRGAVRIEGRGQYLVPGLSDMHVHFLDGGAYDQRLPRLFMYLAEGVTAIRNNEAVRSQTAQKFRHSPAAVEKLTPYIYMAGDTRLFARPGMSADSVAAAYKAASYDFITDDRSLNEWGGTPFTPLGDTIAPDSVVAAAYRLGIPVARHIHAQSFPWVLKLGAYGGSIEHLYVFYDTLEVPGRYTKGKGEARNPETVSIAELRGLAAAMQRAGVWVTPTLDCLTGHEPSSPRSVLFRRVVKALQDAGVGLLIGADIAPAHYELEAFVKAGLTPYQALLTATRNPAQYLNRLDERGTVAVGKRADLVLLSGNPLTDIRHTREPSGVMNAGRWFDRAELDRRLLAEPENLFAMLGRKHAAMLGALLTDSLTAMKMSEPAGKNASERVLQQLATRLGELRVPLTTKQREAFDRPVRAWLREQARQGYRVVVPGVALVEVQQGRGS